MSAGRLCGPRQHDATDIPVCRFGRLSSRPMMAKKPWALHKLYLGAPASCRRVVRGNLAGEDAGAPSHRFKVPMHGPKNGSTPDHYCTLC